MTPYSFTKWFFDYELDEWLEVDIRDWCKYLAQSGYIK